MSRPPLEIGSWGSISSRIDKTDDKGKPIRYLSKAIFRDHDSHVRDDTATGRTRSASETTRNVAVELLGGPDAASVMSD